MQPATDEPSPPPPGLLRDASLFLDFDGTLVEIAERPDAVAVDRRLHALMHLLLERLDGRVAVISGRPAEQVRQLFGGPAFTVVGSHGMEFRWSDGRAELPPRPEAMDEVIAAMEGLAARTPGLTVEQKPLGAALHFRQAPRAEEACRALAGELAYRHGLHLQPGKMMIEVRAPGGDKGQAIRTLMTEPTLAHTRPLFMGDDHTDEPGFAAAATLGGAGILVGPRRPTAARYRLDGVEAALAWLEAACAEAE
jgi:trehalose 6-phosphate phosphatase